MERNHAEEKREKAKMTINYKKLHDNIIFDGYYISNKGVLFNRSQEASWFSKIDYESRCGQVKMVEENIS